jgi:hypothetical protein
MDAHIAVLLDHARSHREGRLGADEVYVWWGKLRSQYRQAPLPHLADVLALGQLIASEDEALELHLYLTDYRSLYVAHLGGVSSDDVRDDPHEAAHIPDYYNKGGLTADCWFQLWDIRRLVLDDTPSVTKELRALRNTRYHDQRVSLYGGMVDLPLIVNRPDGERWFDEDTRQRLTAGRHWVEFDAERAGAGEIQRDLRDNRFGAKLWANLDPAARGFIATAEQLFRAHRNDAAFDLSTVIVDFAKAVEVQVTTVLRAVLKDAGWSLRVANIDGESVDLVSGRMLGLGELARLIGGDRERNEWCRNRLEHGAWFAASLPPMLEELREVRNPATHGGRVERQQVERMRAKWIGVGCKGSLVELAGVRAR